MLTATIKQFEYYKSIAEKAIDQLKEEKLHTEINNDSNSIAIIIKHMHGNMMSRWTDFLTTDGEKEWRKRDAEFEEGKESKVALMQLWQDGWDCLFNALNSIDDTFLQQIIYIRNQGHTVEEAILRQLAHYGYHVGQIVLLAKQLKVGEWESLSIPKGNSKVYNQEKFAQEKSIKHFTDDINK